MKKSTNSHNKGIDRRTLLAGSVLGGLALAIPVPLFAQATLVVTPLKDNIYLISGAGSNVLVALGPDSVLVVDGGLQEFSGPLLQEINNLAQGMPISTLFNTNWRPEHCGLNYTLGPNGADIIAHENTRLWQNNDFSVDWEGQHHTPMPKQTQANRTFYTRDVLTLGNETVEYGWISQCHTDGDMYVHFKESNVLFAGDMLSVSAYPILDYITGGWIVGAQETTAGLLELTDPRTLLIPSAGSVQRRAALEIQQLMLDHAYDSVAEAYRTGRSLEQFMAKAPMAEFDSSFGNPDLFVELLYRGTWYHVPGRAVPGII